MDFTVRESEDQKRFRAAVRVWLQEHFPRDLNIPPDKRPLDSETQTRVKAFRAQLAAKGWLAPSWPKEYGGAGLSQEYESILQEELGRLPLPSMGDNYRWIPAMMVWGTEDQKRQWILPALRGETITWQCFNEPGGGTDLANIRTTATREGNDWVISGEKAFITGQFDPDWLWTLARTDPERPRRLNLGVFMVDARSEGIVIKTQRLLAGSERRVYFNDVRVPGDALVGDPYQGWEIVQTILEGERGGFGFRPSDDGTIQAIHDFLREQRGQS